jgi:ankyrin repeat protein
MTNLFKLIKEKNYSKFISALKEDNIDLDIKDEYGNYLIEYILNTENLELIKKTLENQISLDIIDSNGNTLLYNLIKLNKLDILKIIIENSFSQIGINLLDKKDSKGKTAIHYCIYFNNTDAFKFIIDNKPDPYLKDKNGNNSFFYCIKKERNDFFFKLIELFPNFSIKNKDGDTLIQYCINYTNFKLVDFLLDKNINLNNQNYEYGITALHQLTVNNYDHYIKKFVEKGADVSISDFLGNNLIHFSIMENNISLIEYFISFNKINLNWSNLNGDTALHLFLNTFKSNCNINILKNLVSNTNLNIQNHSGETCFYLIIKYSLIDYLEEELQNKELNIFIQDNNGDNIYFFSKDKDKLVDIVSKSFFNSLSKKKNLIIDWEIKCSFIKERNLKGYYEIKSKSNKELDNLMDETDCLNKIKETIKKNERSVPKLKELNFDLESGLVTKDCFFSGFPIDTLFGILWLKRENPQISLILDYPLSNNENIENFYYKIGNDFNYKLDFINSMILWGYQKIFYPEYFNQIIEREINKKTSIIIIPIGIETSQGAHTNILFWDLKKNIVERFEPNGQNPPLNYDYNPKLLDSLLKQKLITFNDKITYLSPSDYIPIIGFSMIENLENDKCKKIGDPNGFCTAWCIWYCYQKTLNLDIPSEKLIKILINNIKLEGKSFKNLIRNFSTNISTYRDDFLKKVNLDINDWILTNYTEDTLNELEKLIMKIV